MNRREFLIAAMLAVLALGGAVMTELAPSVFPGDETLIFWLGTALALSAIIALIVLFVFARSGGPQATSVHGELRTTQSTSEPTGLPRLSDLTPMPLGGEILLAENVTPSFLMTMLRGRTEVQSESASAPYIGKRMTASGTVIDVSRVLGSMTVSMTPIDCENRGNVYLIFEQDHERLSVIHPGDLLSANGRIKKIKSHDIQLVDCRLI